MAARLHRCREAGSPQLREAGETSRGRLPGRETFPAHPTPCMPRGGAEQRDVPKMPRETPVLSHLSGCGGNKRELLQILMQLSLSLGSRPRRGRIQQPNRAPAGAPPATWHPRGAWGPWPDGPARRQTLPGLAPCLPSPSPPHRALCPRRRFTSTECLLFFFINWALAPALPSLLRLCPGSQRRSLSLSLKTAVAVISSWNNLVTERRARLRAELRGDASLVLIS